MPSRPGSATRSGRILGKAVARPRIQAADLIRRPAHLGLGGPKGFGNAVIVIFGQFRKIMAHNLCRQIIRIPAVLELDQQALL